MVAAAAPQPGSRLPWLVGQGDFEAGRDVEGAAPGTGSLFGGTVGKTAVRQDLCECLLLSPWASGDSCRP